MIRRLRLGFICTTMVLVTILLALSMSLLYNAFRQDLAEYYIRILQTAAAGDRLSGVIEWDAVELCFSLHEDPAGTLVITGGKSYDLPEEEALREILADAQAADRRTGVLDTHSLRFLRTKEGAGYRYFFLDATSELEAMKHQSQVCWSIGVLSFGGLLAITMLTARRMIRPIEQAWQRQRQFVSDASHELKTPLTVVLTNAEMLRSGEYSPQENQHFAESILSTGQQMRDLVERLLELARVDSGRQALHMKPLDLSQAVEDSVLFFEPLYFEQGMTLDSRMEPDIIVEGDEISLSQVLEVLLDNGRKYSAPGSTVTLELAFISRSWCQLKLTSPGEPMTPQECQDIFQRFYRRDKVRSRNQSYGLGLPIAQQIVQNHHGKIWAEAAPNGNIFLVRLPCSRKNGSCANGESSVE